VTFDFEIYFSEVFRQKGGFDVVIGNPPYVLLQGANRDEKSLKYFRSNFDVASYKVDLYHLFIEKGIRLLRDAGSISYITPSNYASNNYTVALRRFMLTKTAIRSLVFFDDDVFEASVNNAVFVATKSPPENVAFLKGKLADNQLSLQTRVSIRQTDLINERCLLIPPENSQSAQILKQIEQNTTSLGEIASANFGMQLRDRREYPNDVVKEPVNKSQLTKYHRECYTGKDIQRYVVTFNEWYCFFNREAKRGGCWDERTHNSKRKILIRQVGSYPEGGLDENGYAVLNTAFMVIPRSKAVDTKFLLAIINSNVVRFYWANRFKDDRKTFPKIKGEYLKLIPIPRTAQEQQVSIIALVDRILAAKHADPAADTSAWEREIDALVYQLYGLTAEEIAVVEGTGA